MRSIPVAIVFASLVASCGGALEKTDDAPAAAPVPTAGKAAPATTCLGHELRWGWVGGWTGSAMPSRIGDCNRYTRVEKDYPPGAEVLRCATTLEATGADGVIGLERLLEDASVQAAFARGGMFGRSRDGRDDSDDRMELDGRSLVIGSDGPPVLEQLISLLRRVDERECPRESPPAPADP